MGLRVCVLASSSAGNSIYIGTDQLNILVDAGLSCKQLSLKLAEIDVYPKDLDAVLVTHDHIDHTRGVGVLARRHKVPVFANAATWSVMEGMIGPVGEAQRCYFENEAPFSLGDITIEPFPIPHDAADAVGFALRYGQQKICIATDLGHVSSNVLNYLRDAELVVLEANHDVEMLRVGSYPWSLKKRIMGSHGHLSNEDAGKTIAALISGMTRRVLLAHMSQENNVPELAYLTVSSIIEAAGFKVGEDVAIGLTYRDRISEMISLA